MKNMSKIGAFALMMGVGTLCVTSCNDPDKPVLPLPDPVPTPIDTIVDPTPDKAMNPVEQKEVMDKVGREVLNLFPSSDYKRVTDLADDLDYKYDDYDFDPVDDWASDVWDGLLKEMGASQETDEWGGVYIYTDYKALVALSNFTGHFTPDDANKTFVRKEANDLKFTVKDADGKDCVATLTRSGAEKQVHLGKIEDWVDYDYGYDKNGQWYYQDYYDRYDITFKVPEHITLTVTQGGETLLTVNADIDLGALQNTEFNLAKSTLGIKVKATLYSGVEINVENVQYDPKNVKASVAVSKSSQKIITCTVSTSLSGIPSCNLSAFTDEDYVDDRLEDDFIDAQGKDTYVKVDVMGKVQFQGTLSRIHKLVDYLEKMGDNKENEKEFKSYMTQVNGLMNLGVFYDNTSTRQARVVLEAFEDDYDYYDDEKYWYAEPVIHFYDGTSYSTMSAFFDEDDFKRLVDTFEDLVDAYDAMIEF